MRWILSMLIVCVLSGTYSNLQCQEQCNTSCDTLTAPWTNTTITVNVSGSCQIVLQVRKRVCAGIYELQVLGAIAQGTCTAIDIQAEVAKAIKVMVTNNLMNFPPGATDGVFTWRISRPSCWSVHNGQPSPCNVECCISYLRVEKRVDCNTWSITNETLRALARVCPLSLNKSSEDVQSSEQPCAFMCDRIAPFVK